MNIREAIEAVLAADSTITGLLAEPVEPYDVAIYHGEAPQGAQGPYVIFFKRAGTPQHVMQARVGLDWDVWAIQGIDRDDTKAAEDLAEAIDVCVSNAALDIDGREVNYFARLSDISYGDPQDGETWRHEGADYRLTTELA